MVWIGYRHFDNIHTGVAAATLYLLTFYTSQMTSHVDHVVPAALLVWAVAAYRLPMLSGMLLGLAAGLIYYPLFLLPLWCSFYWRRGLVRFVVGVLLALAVLAAVAGIEVARSGHVPRPIASHGRLARSAGRSSNLRASGNTTIRRIGFRCWPCLWRFASA